MTKVRIKKTDLDYEILMVEDAKFYTRSYKEDKFKRNVKTKGVTIYVDETDTKKLTDFGLTVYSATDEKTKQKVFFIMTNFSGNLEMYDTESKTKKHVLFDNSYPNVFGEHYDFAIMSFENDKGKDYTRVCAMKGAASGLTRQSIDYFGDDDQYTDDSNIATE